MRHQNLFLRLMAVLLLVAMLAGTLPVSILAAEVTPAATAAETMQEKPATRAAATETAQDRMYYDAWSSIPHYSDCTAMQGMAVLGDYIYSLKKNSGDTNAAIFRTSRFGTETEQMTIDGAASANYLGHGNDMCAAQVGSESYLFVATMKSSVGALACFKISDNALTKVAVFDVYTLGGSKITPTGVDVYAVDGNKVTLLIANSTLIFMATVDVTAPGTELRCSLGFEVDSASMREAARAACGMPTLEATIQGSGFYNDTYYMPLTMHHNHETEIKVDNHADSASVIVAFPNIAAAIAETKRDVKASLSETINLPDAGWLFFEVESVDFVDGIAYFSTNRVSIDRAYSAVSFLLDPDADTELLTKRAAFRNDGLYKVSGGDATDQFLYDPGADDGHILAGAYPDDVSIYFGFESNEQGFYYIRSMRTKKYLTVNADCTVTQSEKKEGDPSQLFCLTQVESPNNLGKVAIISMLNFQYLDHKDSTGLLITKAGGKTFRLHAVKDTAKLETYLFDLNLYKKCYPEVCEGKTDAQIKTYYLNTGKALGHVASIYFDPEYYLANNPDVARNANFGTLAGAYNHFVQHGFWEGRQGSLYFSLNEYLHQEGNDALKLGDYPDKLYYLNHFNTYGVNESENRPERNGSDEFQVKEVVAKYGLDPASGYDFIVDVISRNVRLRSVETQDDLEKILFDWEYYYNKYSVALSEEKLDNAGYKGNSHAEKLLDHWKRTGIYEGRTASPYFSQVFYRTMYPDCLTNENPSTEAEKRAANKEAYDHFVQTGFWANRAGSPYYDGEVYIRSTEFSSEFCEHRQTVTSTTASTCTVNGSSTTYCALCRTALKTKKLPLAEHVDVNADKTCDICGIILSGNTVLKGAIEHLVEPAPVNEYYDLKGVTFADAMYDGFYYMVQKNSDGKYRVFDTLNQTVRGSFAATEVTVKDGAIYGAHPDMAVELKLVSAGSNGKEGTYNILINGPYYLGYGNNSITGTYGEARRMTSKFNMSLRVLYDVDGYTDRFRIWRAIADTTNGVASTPHWLGMHDNDGFKYYRFTTNVYANDDNTFYLYKLLFDRLHTEDMYATLKESALYIDPNAFYNTKKHEAFRDCLRECVDLYNKYNGTILKGDDLTNREALQEAMDEKMLELINLRGYLRINAEGKTIRHFPANMYNYNEDNMNALVNVMEGADTHGFFFESGKNKNTTAYYSVYESGTNEEVKGRTIRSQMYSISSGIAASDLTTATNPPFANSVVTADFWSETPIANAKEVYKSVGVPFIYDDGYYVLNSDENAVFFEDEPADGAQLAILEQPATYYWSGGMDHGVALQSYVSEDYTTHHYADGYVTGFQPFAKMTNRKAEGYKASASVFEASEPIEGYLLDGVAFNSLETPTPAVSNSGTAVWGFGMKLVIGFMMTSDGRLVDENKTPITFEFSGDDDVWVYIDGKLVLDIGGSHDAIQGVIDFTDGSVTVRSDKYDRIRDKNTDGYGWSDSDRYDASQLSSVHAITTNQMHQKNLYTEVFKQSIAEFAYNDGEPHEMVVYYMDRGKGRTNSTIKFNLPQTDTLTVEKEVKCADYENGELVTMSAEKAAPLMQKLSTLNFSYVLTDNGKAVANQTYTLIDNGVDKGEKTTNASGTFTLKHGQSAVFSGLNFTADNKYKVVETTPLTTWFDVAWTHTTTGDGAVTATAPAKSKDTYNANTSSTVSITGDLYANETLTFNCTNTFVNVPLEKDRVIVDYGKSVDIDIFENDPQFLFAHYYVRSLHGFLPYDENLDLIASRKHGGGTTLSTDNGNYTIVDNKVHFEPKRMLNEVEKVFCVVKYTKGTDYFYVYEELQIVPSNIMYYETDFADGVRDLPENNDCVLMDFGPDDTTEWKSVSGITVTKDTANGVLHGEINAATTPWMGMNYHTDQLNYVIQPGDVVNIRLKVKVTSASSYSGIQMFMTTDEYNYYREETSIKDSKVKTHVSDDYVVLQYPVNALLFGQRLTEFRLDPFDGASNVKGTVDVDYIYIGPERHDDFLYFDFDNTDADRLRYSQAQYGGHNYDTGAWSSRTYTMKRPTFDNNEGTMQITTLTDPDPQYGFAYYFQLSPNVPMDFDLHYNPAELEVIRLRLKLENFVPNGTPGMSIAYYESDEADYNPEDGSDSAIRTLNYRFGIDPKYLETEEYFTVEIPASAMQKHERISTIRFNILSVKDVERGAGIVTVDYVYVGPAAKAPSEDYLFFDFGNTAADQIRYNRPEYGNVNFDKGNWVIGAGENYTAYTIDNETGTLALNISSVSTNNGPYLSVTNGTGTDYPWSGNKSHGVLAFDGSDVEVMKLRFKVIGATKITEDDPQAQFISHYKRNTQELYYGSAGSNTTYQLTEDDWITMSVDISTAFQDGDVLETCGVWFSNLTTSNGGQVIVDYIYFGSEEDFQKLGLAERGTVYVDDSSDWQTLSDDIASDGMQDNGLLDSNAYLLLNFEDNVDFSWRSSARASINIDAAKGVMKGEITGGDPFIGMDSNAAQVNYKFKKGDVVQVRMKAIVNETDDMSDTASGFQFFFVNRADNTYNAIEDRKLARNFGQWETITIPVPEKYIGWETGSIRIDPIDCATARVLKASYEVDYIYVGPEKKAPGNDAIYFSFDNDDLSAARYGTEIYGGFNGDIDPWSANLERNTELQPGEDEGTRAFTENKDANARYHYIRSSADGVYGYSLNHKPSADDVLQIRVKFKNFKQGNTKPYLTMTYYSGDDIFNADRGDAGVEVSRRLYFDPAYLNNNEYITLTLPMDASYAERTRISTFCVFLSEMVSLSKTEIGVATIDYIYLGLQSDAPIADNMTLGYDSSYENDAKLSNGDSLHVEGLGVPKLNSDYTPKPGVFTETSFTFTGTGFDVISRTGEKQGAIRAMIYDAGGKYVKTVSVLNKSEKKLELYQVPVLSVDGLAHGTYTARIFVNAAYDYNNDGNADQYHGDLDRGGEFYFDAVRIYNPIDTSSQARATKENSKLAYSAYLGVAEADQNYTEVRNMLIDANSYSAGGTMSGVVYLDNTDKGTTIADYKSFGPNNEVYLAKGAAIAFRLDAEGVIPTSIDVGAKSADGKAANLTVSISADAPTALPSKQNRTVSASTVQYYSLDIPAAAWNMKQDAHNVYVIIRNVDGAGILSLTDIKYAYDRTAVAEAVSRKLRFVVDAGLVDALTSGKPNDPEISEELCFTTNITAGAEMNVAYSIKADTVAEYEDFYLEVTKRVAGGEPITVTYDKGAMNEISNPNTGEVVMYSATYKGINAKEMGDSFTATLYAVAEDGRTYRSSASSNSIRDYLIGKFHAEKATPELKTMVIDMLKYGAAAQRHLGYDTENLVTAELTQEQLSFATQSLPEATDHYAANGNGAKISASITLDARVRLTLSTILRQIEPGSTVRCVIADEKGDVLAEPIVNNMADVMYSALYEDVGAREMRKVITATFYCGEEAVSETMSWSVESYVAQVRAKDGVSAKELELVNAMLTYGDAIAAYLTSTGQ